MREPTDKSPVPRQPSLVFAMSSACSVSGGIQAVNLNVLHALADLVKERMLQLTVLSLLESSADRPGFLPSSASFHGFGGGKPQFAAALLSLAVGRPTFFFERVGLALPILPLAATRRVRTIIFAHGWENWLNVRPVDRWSIRASARVLTNSNYTLAKMRQSLRSFSGKACPLGLSPAFALNSRPPEPPTAPMHFEACDSNAHELGPHMLLLVGRMHSAERQKGHLALLKALPTLLERYPDVQLVFAGDGEDREHLRRLAQQTGVAWAVFLPGWVPSHVLDDLYRRCYAFVMPSKQEGFGLVYLEAMNHAKACLGCFDDGAEEVIVNGATGLLIHDPNNPQELLAALCALLGDPERARQLGANGFQRLHAQFTARQFQTCLKDEILAILRQRDSTNGPSPRRFAPDPRKNRHRLFVHDA